MPLLLYIVLFGHYLFPRFHPTQSNGTLRVLSFNILYSNYNYQGLAQVIESQQPDLVALQEVQPEAMEQLINLLTADFPYHKFGTLNPFGTTAIFSRLPIEDMRVLDLQADRAALGVRVHQDGHSIFFISAHLRAFGWPQILYFLKHGSYATALSTARRFRVEQNQQARILLDAITESPDDTMILACDCNTKDLMSTYGLLSNQLQDASRAVGLQPWFSMPPNQYLDINPQHVDHIFYGGLATPVAVYKLKANAGSDHNPLVVDFSLADDGNKRKSQ